MRDTPPPDYPPVGDVAQRLSPRAHGLRRAAGRFWRDYQWFLLGLLWALALLLGSIGFQRYGQPSGASLTVSDLLYFTAQLVVLESGSLAGSLPWQLDVARFLLPGLAAYTALQALALLFREQLQFIRLRMLRNHVIICGLSRKALLLTAGFLNRGDTVVLVERNEANDQIQSVRGHGALVLIGDATDPMTLERAGLLRAKCLIAVCAEDSINAEIAFQAQRALAGRSARVVTGLVHMVDPQLCALLRELELDSSEGNGLRLALFNIYDSGAQWLLRHYPIFDPAVSDSGPAPRILLVGMGLLGESLLVHAARHAYGRPADHRPALRVTVIAPEAEKKVAALQARYPRLSPACQVTAITVDMAQASFQADDALAAPLADSALRSIFVCMDDDTVNLKIGLTLAQKLSRRGTPIVTCMREANGLSALLGQERRDGSVRGDLHAFPLLDHTCTPDLLLGGTHEILARALHEEYVRHQTARQPSSKVDPSLVPWEQLPEALKESNRQQVDQIGAKLKAVGCGIRLQTDWDAPRLEFTPEQVETMARMEHERWVEALTETGWRFAPPPKNQGKKTHPALLPWARLPEDEREKNRESVRSLPEFLARSGFGVTGPR